MRTLHHDNDDLVVIGIPCNQFGGQEPGTEPEILEFVTSKFDVDFPMFSKVDVNGDDECELYTLLKAAQPGEGDSPDIVWNFTKFLVDGDGEVVKRWEPTTTPEDIAGELDQYR